MEKDLAKLDSLIVKQAVRDVASKDVDLSKKALSYFNSLEFITLCLRNKIDVYKVQTSINELSDYPLLSRKKMSNDIAKVIDNLFVGGDI
tara:strand:+ start:65 stop:334 length:270 start_codon:yes stop_codon:yes gene_type:complete